MNKDQIKIVPLEDSRAEEVWKMEKDITQGTNIQLEIIKEDFHSRDKVFRSHYSNMALDDNDAIVGASIGAIVPLSVNGEVFDSGYGFDAKVIPALRKKGIGKLLAKNVYKEFFRPNGLQKCFMIAKLNNQPVLKLISKALNKVWLYSFVYLTIPTTAKIPSRKVRDASQSFTIKLYPDFKDVESFASYFPSGLGYFHTWKMYQLRIKKVSPLLKNLINILSKLSPLKYGSLPKENDVLSFATLFNHTAQNLDSIPSILEELKQKDIGYLLVCCKKNDITYQYLRRHSINTYKYNMITDFPIQESDSVAIDVRCL